MLSVTAKLVIPGNVDDCIAPMFDQAAIREKSANIGINVANVQQ